MDLREVWCLSESRGTTLRTTQSRLLVAAAPVAVLGFVAAAAQQPYASGSYTAAQAAGGQSTYDQRCAECHLQDLKGGSGPELAGPNFLKAWGSRTTRELFELIRSTMPPGGSSLTDEGYVDVVAYIL